MVRIPQQQHQRHPIANIRVSKVRGVTAIAQMLVKFHQRRGAMAEIKQHPLIQRHFIGLRQHQVQRRGTTLASRHHQTRGEGNPGAGGKFQKRADMIQIFQRLRHGAVAIPAAGHQNTQAGGQAVTGLDKILAGLLIIVINQHTVVMIGG